MDNFTNLLGDLVRAIQHLTKSQISKSPFNFNSIYCNSYKNQLTLKFNSQIHEERENKPIWFSSTK